MHTFLNYVPLAMMVGIYAAYLKLSARLLRYTQVTWGRCLIAGVIVVAITLLGQLVAPASGGVGMVLLSLLFGFTGHIVLGGFLFRGRALDSMGQPLPWTGGAKLAALSFLMLALTGVLLAIVTNSLSSPVKP